MDDFHNSRPAAAATFARLVEVVQGDNATVAAAGSRSLMNAQLSPAAAPTC